MSVRGMNPKLSKYSVRLYKLPKKPQIKYRLPSQPPRYCLYITNGSTKVRLDVQRRTLDQVAEQVAHFIASENEAHQNHTMFHYIARFRESVPEHLQGTGSPLTDEEYAKFHKKLHYLTHHGFLRK